MRRPTDMMRSILTNEIAQKIIDYVPPVYGDSYVGLWIFQAIGALVGEVRGICEALMSETTPATATLLLDYWEDQYGLQRDSSLTNEQRRSRIIRKICYRGPCNPAVLAANISNALGGIRVDIKENVSKNMFLILLYDTVYDLSPAIKVVERMKPAHLIYDFTVVPPEPIVAEVNVGVAMTRNDKISVQLSQNPMLVSYDEDSGTTTLSIPDSTVEIDDNGVVTVSGLDEPVSYDGSGIVTIGS